MQRNITRVVILVSLVLLAGILLLEYTDTDRDNVTDNGPPRTDETPEKTTPPPDEPVSSMQKTDPEEASKEPDPNAQSPEPEQTEPPHPQDKTEPAQTTERHENGKAITDKHSATPEPAAPSDTPHESGQATTDEPSAPESGSLPSETPPPVEDEQFLRRFEKTKHLLADIHQEIGHLNTFYCGCPYVRKGTFDGDIDRDDCGLEARQNEDRSGRVEWEHVVPPSWFGRTRQCWQSGHELCVKKDGTPFKGRECCTRHGVDSVFAAAYNDPHNLFPAGGELKDDRSDYPFGTVEGEPRNYGSCDFEVDGSQKVAEPAEGVRGEIARAMLYVADWHGMDVKMAHDELLEWHESDPPEDWELARTCMIEDMTGLAGYIGTCTK